MFEKETNLYTSQDIILFMLLAFLIGIIGSGGLGNVLCQNTLQNRALEVDMAYYNSTNANMEWKNKKIEYIFTGEK